MTDSSSKLRDTGELEIIQRILSRLPLQDELIVPPGDDSAVVRLTDSNADLVLTSDPVIEGTHFQPGTRPAAIGHKAAGRVLSDLAAMGASPKWVLLNIAAPAGTNASDITAISDSAASLCAEFGAAVVGGDIASSPILSVNAFACGTVPKGSSVTRSGARPDDLIFATDTLGGSIHAKHLDFMPRVREGIWLRENAFPSSMIDITDGLASDLRHILQQSSVGAIIDLSSIPVSEALKSLPADARMTHALSDGEDFELLFTVHPSRSRELLEKWPQQFNTRISLIGSINSNTGIILYKSESGEYNALTLKGYQHFEENCP